MNREEAKNIISQMIKDEEGFLSDNTVEAHKMAIEALEQEPKTGYWMHWISHYEEDEKVGWYECDRCHTERAFKTKFCPDCGAKMQEVGE